MHIKLLPPEPKPEPDPCTWPTCECKQSCEEPNEERIHALFTARQLAKYAEEKATRNSEMLQ